MHCPSSRESRSVLVTSSPLIFIGNFIFSFSFFPSSAFDFFFIGLLSFLLASVIVSSEGSSSLIFLVLFVFFFNGISTRIVLRLVGTLHLMGDFRLDNLGLPGPLFSFLHSVHLNFLFLSLYPFIKSSKSSTSEHDPK